MLRHCAERGQGKVLPGVLQRLPRGKVVIEIFGAISLHSAVLFIPFFLRVGFFSSHRHFFPKSLERP